MELTTYLNSRVHIICFDGFYYKGKVIDADADSITIIDLTNQKVSLSKNTIESIKEMNHGC